MTIHLLIIDPQNSFCDPKGELYVSHAEQDMARLVRFIHDQGDSLGRITVTLDSHNRMHIAHPVWWRDHTGNEPKPFTVISADDLRDGRYTTADPKNHDWSLRYLEKTVPHVIWPMHCLAGTWGHQVFEPLNTALSAWADRYTDLEFIFKGSSRYTEHFSAIRPSLEVPDDPSTRTNRMLVKTLGQADRILVAGEAASHCVAETVKDLIADDPDLVKKIILLKNCMSPVAGFEDLAKHFFTSMTNLGVTITDTINAGVIDI